MEEQKISEDISGHVTLDTYLVFDKSKVTNENSRLTNKRIGFDTYVYEFHRDLYSTSDSYAEAVLSLNKYIDALDEYAKDVIEQMFDSCTFDIWKTSYTSDVEVASNGIATIYMNSNVWFDGVNLSLPRDKIVAEIKQRIDNRNGGNLAAIADALIAVFVDVYID